MNKSTYEGLTLNQLAESNAEHVTAIARLEAQVKQLAAENAALKSSIEFSEPWLPSCDDEVLHRIKVAKETTATDAILASLRAEGVEMFADNYLCPDIDADIRAFAAQLRRKSEVQS